MKPESIGRVVGVGMRVAGRVAAQRLAGPAATPSPQAAQHAPRAQVRTSGKTNGSLARGVGGFLKPFGRAGSIVWLQVTGLFFSLPVLVFAPTLWRTRLSYVHGPDHRTFVSSAVVVAVFFYLSVSSFWRARKRSATPPL
ncbi:MAG TPA: hypothetical protein VE291_08170 [Terracidiphilus sp.]|jgi:hypothetical protein|nr:hypothetical protein [Terracidiphilus sp.]